MNDLIATSDFYTATQRHDNKQKTENDREENSPSTRTSTRNHYEPMISLLALVPLVRLSMGVPVTEPILQCSTGDVTGTSRS